MNKSKAPTMTAEPLKTDRPASKDARGRINCSICLFNRPSLWQDFQKKEHILLLRRSGR